MAAKKKISILKPENQVKEYLSTGSLLLDLSISCNKTAMGGVPSNRIIEFSGTGGACKTYVCGEIAGDALSKGYDLVVIDDIERRWDLDRLETFGFSMDKESEVYAPNFHYMPEPSSSVEKCFETLFKVLKANIGKKVLYIIDPIAALYSEKELTGSDKMGQARAKALQKNMRFLKDYVTSGTEGVATIIFSNQLIDNIGVMFGDKKTEPCGNAMKHWPSIRVRFTQTAKLSDDVVIRKDVTQKNIVGIALKSIVRKNSEDNAYRSTAFTVRFGYGIDNIYDCITWLHNFTTILDVPTEDEKGIKAGWFKLAKGEPIYGKRAFVKYIEDAKLEPLLFKLTTREYKKFHKPEDRKPKQRF